ncbi:MAG: ATP-binding protein [Byssovorax sp.]
MASTDVNKIALRAAKAALDSASLLEIELDGTAVRVAPEPRQAVPWPTLPENRPLDGITESQDGPWPSPVCLRCSWNGGEVLLELRLNIWRQRGQYEGHLALQAVTVPRNREIMWVNLTKRIEDGMERGKCSIPANFALWVREGERTALPLTGALVRSAKQAGLQPLAATQFLLFELTLPEGSVSPSPSEVFARIVKTAILKLPYVTRGEESDIVGSPPFDISAARRVAAELTPADPAPPLEPSVSGPEPAIASSQDNVFFDFIAFHDFAAFRDFEWRDMARINVIVGANDTGKSHVLKMMYALVRSVQDYTARHFDADRPSWAKVLTEKLIWTFEPENAKLGTLVHRAGLEPAELGVLATLCNEEYTFSLGPEAAGEPGDFRDITKDVRPQPDVRALFIPPKEVLTSLNAIAAVRERLKTFGFDDTYYDLVLALRGDPMEAALPDPFQKVLDALEELLEGRIETVQGRLMFLRGDEKHGMSQTAEGIKKIGILTRLIKNGELRRNSILFLDEPETNLHPRAARALVGMLYDLSRAGVQVFLATHSYFVLKQLEIVARAHEHPVMLCSLERGPSGVQASFFDLQKGMPETGILTEALRQYDEDVVVSEQKEG